MSLKATLIRSALNLTPSFLVTLIANLILRGIAQLTFFDLNLDRRILSVRFRLYGEPDSIDLVLENFRVIQHGTELYFMLSAARSNRPWLVNLFARVTQRAVPIPDLPVLRPYVGLILELLGERSQPVRQIAKGKP